MYLVNGKKTKTLTNISPVREHIFRSKGKRYIQLI